MGDDGSIGAVDSRPKPCQPTVSYRRDYERRLMLDLRCCYMYAESLQRQGKGRTIEHEDSVPCTADTP